MELENISHALEFNISIIYRMIEKKSCYCPVLIAEAYQFSPPVQWHQIATAASFGRAVEEISFGEENLGSLTQGQASAVLGVCVCARARAKQTCAS